MRPGRVGVRGAQPGSAPCPDYFLFSEMLMQRPVRLGQLWRSHRLSRKEAAYMQAMAREHFAGIMTVLKALPRPLLLVLRNINTVRAINTSLGAPVDRYFLMAKRWVPAGRPGRGRAARAWLTTSPAVRSEAGAAWWVPRVSTEPASCATSGLSGRRSSSK